MQDLSEYTQNKKVSGLQTNVFVERHVQLNSSQHCPARNVFLCGLRSSGCSRLCGIAQLKVVRFCGIAQLGMVCLCGTAQLAGSHKLWGFGRNPARLDSKSGVDVFLVRNMSGARPRGSVGVAWQAMKEAKTGGKDGTAAQKGKSKADHDGDAVLSVETAVTVVTVKFDVVNVTVEKTATEMAKTIVVEQAKRNVLSESA